MTTPSETELAQRLEIAERKLDAISDILVFMAAHVAEVAPERGEALALQLRDVHQMNNVEWPEAFLTLLARMGRAFDGNGLDLDSLR